MIATPRHVSDSRSVQTYLLMPMHLNSKGSLFGGQLLTWIDMLSGIVALRHTDANVTTVAIDHLEFKCPAHLSDVITLDGRVTWTGHTSMEVRVDTWKENKGGERQLINTAYIVMVGVDDNDGHPVPIPPLEPETDEERAEWAAAEKRAKLRKQRRQEAF